MRPLPSPPERFNDFSNHTVNAIRVTHCRLLSADMADIVAEQVRKKERELADLAALLSVCEASKAHRGDTGWVRAPFARMGDEGADADADEDMIRLVPMHPELLRAALSARPGALQTTQTTYGWEVFVVEDVQHAVLATSRGARRGAGFPITPHMRRTSRKKPAIEAMSYYIETFGCQMNALDSQRMRGELERAGYHATADARRSAVYVLNTCALRDHAEQKVYSYLGPQAQRKWDAGGEVTLVVAGCVAQQEGEKLLRRVPEVDVVMGPQYANRIGEVLEDFRGSMTQLVAVDPIHIHEDLSRPRRGSRVTAWVNIMYGCLEKCSYCVVPTTRGVEQSRSMGAIRAELEQLVREGFREVVLLGQNVDAYGRDLYPKRTLSELLRYVHNVDGVDRIRFTTGHPRYISGRLIETVATLPKVMEHFHIPPQSGDNGVLRAMGRGYTRERYMEIARRIRERMPDAAICADTIVGFPGESAAAFERTVELAREVVFDANMVRGFSARPGTRAGEMEREMEAGGMSGDGGRVSEAEKLRRVNVMNAVMREQAGERSRRWVGRTVEVLVEGVNPKVDGEVMGRERSNRVVFFEGAGEALVGRIVAVEVDEAFAFSLRGRAVGQPW